MTTAEFEKAAKRAVANYEIGINDNDVFPSDFQVVWMCHLLGNKKCILFNAETERIYEVTFNSNAGELYLDAYEKVHNRKIPGDQIPALLGKNQFGGPISEDF